MKTKLEMAHDYVMNYLSNPSCENATVSSIVSVAWSYADAMQAEADKREKKTSCDTNVNFDVYLEYDASINYPPDAWVMYKGEKRLAVSINTEKEWQPDWSQAPEWANWWVKTMGGSYLWCIHDPIMNDDYFRAVAGSNHAPSFGYTGDWRNSLRKRPQ